MEESEGSRQVVRFGVFEVDLQAEELRKSGVKIKLRRQPFQVLRMLLERPGEIVTREEIQDQPILRSPGAIFRSPRDDQRTPAEWCHPFSVLR